jgi:hypothetical protein
MKNQIKSIGFRASDDFYFLIRKVSADRGEDVSDFVRRAVRKELAELSYYPDHVKKALGLLNAREEET